MQVLFHSINLCLSFYLQLFVVIASCYRIGIRNVVSAESHLSVIIV
jgi:hypothetical protein